MPKTAEIEELQAQLENHDDVKIVDDDGFEFDITNVSFDGELNVIVIEIIKE